MSTLNSRYGQLPKCYTLNGNKYYIGSEVGNYLKLHRDALYKQYPLLPKTIATEADKKQMEEFGVPKAFLRTKIILLNFSDVQDILKGNEKKFTSVPLAVEYNAADCAPPTRSMVPQIHNQMSAGTHHLESIPCSTPSAVGRGKPCNREMIYHHEWHFDNSQLLENASHDEELVPIRLDMDIDGVRVRDTFCYNRNEQLITPQMFAQIMCEDLELPIASFLHPITQQIQQQLNAHQEIVPIDEPDLRAVLKLHIHVGNESLTDQFEWDMSNKELSPEQFATSLCKDLSVGGEFQAAIAYSIRGQLAWNQRTCAYSENPLPKVEYPVRGPLDLDLWTPQLETLSDAEVEKKMRDQDRNTRRMRRLVNSNPYQL
ncbi:hypothetical protein FO519_003277 [Halicephalobus sp. NKZ332]|nr:hypothetical protein FO519_003277 [Halicephalobus sp. NKZ332]